MSTFSACDNYYDFKIIDHEKCKELSLQDDCSEELLVNCGINNVQILNVSESEFLKCYLSLDIDVEEFSGMKVIFVTGPSGSRISDKNSYFKSIKSYNLRGMKISTSLLWLNKEQKTNSGGYDAIITYWVKRFSKRQLKRIIKKVEKPAKQE